MELDWHYYPETHCSTQDLAKEWSAGNLRRTRTECRLDGESCSVDRAALRGIAVFCTFSQQKGRGQAGNVWFGGKGDNIAMTLAFYPENLDASDLFSLDMALSLGLLRYARRIDARCCLKWPNDLYSGLRKLAGILLETRIRGTHVEEVYFGIGLNMNQEFFPENLPNPISFRQLDGKVRDLEKESCQLASDIGNAYDMFLCQKDKAGERGGLFEIYKKEYLGSMLFYGQWRDFLFRGKRVHARIEDVDECGCLWLRDSLDGMFLADIKELRYCLPV